MSKTPHPNVVFDPSVWNTRMRCIWIAFHDYMGEVANVIDPIRMVGGCVRDIILKETPKDIDFCTPLKPDQMIEALRQSEHDFGYKQGELFEIIPTGLQHGTITVRFPGTDEQYEVTTLRRDVQTDGRHAEVEFVSDYQADAERRDFTMNAMSVNLEGYLFDYFGGFEDAQQRLVRFIGDPKKRLEEDYLRVLRFYRFSARFGRLSYDYNTAKALNEAFEGLQNISGERIWAELSKILTYPNPDMFLRDLTSYRFARCALGMREFINFMTHARTYLGESRLEHLRARGASPALMLFAWVHWSSDDSGNRKETIDLIVNRLKLSRAVSDTLYAMNSFLFSIHGQYRDPKDAVLHEVIDLKHARDAASLVNQDWDPTWEPPVFPVAGQDLLDAGVPAGRLVGMGLKEMRQMWAQKACNGVFMSKAALMQTLGMKLKETPDGTNS